MLCHLFPLLSGEAQLLRLSYIQSSRTFCLQMFDKQTDRLSFLFVVIVERVEHTSKSPLCPAVELGVACAYLAVPVVRETYLAELLLVAGDVLLGSYLGVLSGLDSILLSRQTISIEAHRVEHIEALLALVARIDVGGYIAQRMTHMQACSGRVGKHVEYIELGFRTEVAYFVDVVVVPLLLPAFFDVFEIIVHDVFLLLIVFANM